MKPRILIYLIMAPIVLAIGSMLWLNLREKSIGPAAPALTDSLKIESLPVDKKTAQRELDQALKTLRKIVPAGKYIVIDTHANILTLRTANSIIFKADCSTGSGGELTDSITGRRWIFNTPHGIFKINSKLVQPWWRKPDWAYIEDSLKPPEKESERYDPEMMGDYAMGFGDGYFIHGTIYERLIGVSVTHGCVRLGADDLKYLYGRVPIGTSVYIF